jgi:WD40 repeat protein
VLQAHPVEEGLLAAGGQAGSVAPGALQLWRLHAQHPPAFLQALSTLPTGGWGMHRQQSHGSVLPQQAACVTALCWDAHSCGARLAACTADGAALLWRCGAGAAATASLPAFPGHAQGGAATGVAFLSPTLLCVSGAGGGADGGSSLVLWDALSPPRCARVACFAAHSGSLGSAGVAPSPLSATVLLSLGAERGDTAAFDLRAAASSGAAAPMWRHAGSAAPGACIALWRSVAAVGDRHGEVRLLDVRSGRLQQALGAAHARGSFTPVRHGATLHAAVTHLLPLHSGLLSAGADGTVRLWPSDGMC